MYSVAMHTAKCKHCCCRCSKYCIS